MSQGSLWLGHLDIGDKSSPVVRDQKLNTGKPDTIYLFNLLRNEIIEYKRSIVEPKLRELNGDEAAISKDLKKAFNKAIKDFTPRGKLQNIPDSAPIKAEPAKKVEDDEFIGVDMDEDGDDEDLFDDEDED